MALRLSAHARRRMEQRRISEDEIAETWANRETTYPSRDKPDRTVILGRSASGRRLMVVVLTNDEEFVITAAERAD